MQVTLTWMGKLFFALFPNAETTFFWGLPLCIDQTEQSKMLWLPQEWIFAEPSAIVQRIMLLTTDTNVCTCTFLSDWMHVSETVVSKLPQMDVVLNVLGLDSTL